MSAVYSALALLVLTALVLVGVSFPAGQTFFGTVVPYLAIAVFIIGIVYRVLSWARSPVPFRITTTCGQQKSFPWMKSNNLESPHNIWGVIGRMALEILFFRSLFRNTAAELREGPRLAYGSAKWLWLGGMVFHWSFFVVFIRHFKFFAEPVPEWVMVVQNLDGFMQVGLPIIYVSSVGLLAGLTFLFLRRVVNPQLRYLSMAGDYFPLFILAGIAISGCIMRYTSLRVDITVVKMMATGLISLNPTLPDSLGAIFYVHLFMVSLLMLYFPFSKLVHMAGVFMTPTRNLANNNRVKRHVNPWDYPVKTHTYMEWEDEFRDVMKAAGMPLEKEE